MYIRAFRLCDSDSLQGEMDILFDIFTDLQYPRWLILDAISRAKSKFYNPGPRV